MTAAERRRRQAETKAFVARQSANLPRCPVHGDVLHEQLAVTSVGTGEIVRGTGVFQCVKCIAAADVAAHRSEGGRA